MEAKKSIFELIGDTPLIQISDRIFAKAEFLNPGGSIKDRVALAMIRAVELSGELKPGGTIVEPTSGNTGIGLALVGVRLGYRVVIVMPENMSAERKKIIRMLGAELVLTPTEENVDGAVRKAKEIAEKESAFMPNQFENEANLNAHFSTTAPEIWRQTDGNVAAFVAGVGSGGTLAGVGKFLREKNPDVFLAAVEPAGVSAILGHEPGLHQIQGIGDGFVPAVLNVSILDEVIEVSDDEAITETKKLADELGLLVGTSSGANVFAARKLAEKIDGNILTVLPDRAERYFSTALFEN